jgi:transporter family-2 protein|tara:strand:+ start:395 stop:865 length:471 start_codon:yes stop_codon:yes gene_type:complete
VRIEQAAYAAIMIVAGLGIPVMAAMSGSLGGRLGSAPAATSILFGVALLLVIATTVVTGVPTVQSFIAAPKYLFLGGACVAFYALSITFIGPRFGIANAILCVLLGQMLCSAVIDHFGLLGAPAIEIDRRRIVGLALMAIGLFLARSLPAAGPTGS